MEKYRKEFRRWAEVAEEVERKEACGFVKAGAVYWCNIGPGIGHELVGKGANFTRPVLVLSNISEHMALVILVTSKDHSGGNYMEIVVAGVVECLALMHFRVIDVRRLGEFIDEVPSDNLRMIRNRFLKLLKRYLYGKE